MTFANTVSRSNDIVLTEPSSRIFKSVPHKIKVREMFLFLYICSARKIEFPEHISPHVYCIKEHGNYLHVS